MESMGRKKPRPRRSFTSSAKIPEQPGGHPDRGGRLAAARPQPKVSIGSIRALTSATTSHVLAAAVNVMDRSVLCTQNRKICVRSRQ